MASVDLVRRSYDAFARDDLDGVLGDMDPEIEWHQAQGLPHGGTYRGLDEVRREHLRPARRASGGTSSRPSPDEFLDAGAQVVVVGRYRGVGKQPANIWTFRSSISGP